MDNIPTSAPIKDSKFDSPNCNYSHPTDLPLRIKISVRIEALDTMRKFFINNTEVSQEDIGTRSQLAEVAVYSGTLSLNNNDANAVVYNVIFTSNSVTHGTSVNKIPFTRPTVTDYGWSAEIYYSPLQLCEGFF